MTICGDNDPYKDLSWLAERISDNDPYKDLSWLAERGTYPRPRLMPPDAAEWPPCRRGCWDPPTVGWGCG